MADWGNAFSMSMKAGAGLIDAEIKRDAKKQDEMEAEQRAADLKLKIEERMSAIREASDIRAEERRESMRLRGKKADFEFETNPENVKAKATAKVAEMEMTEPVKSRLAHDAEKKQLNDPEYIAGLGKKARATHIESAASIAAANLSAHQLQKAKEFEALQDDYANAVAAGNAEKAKELASRIEAKNFTGKAKDVQAYIHAATQARKLAAESMDPAEKEELKKKADLYEGLAGIGQAKAAGTTASTPPEAAIAYLKKNPGTVEDFKKKYPGFDVSSAIATDAPEKPRRGLVDMPAPKAEANAPSYDKWIAAKRKLEEVKSQAKNMSPDRRESFLGNRIPEIEAEIEFHSKYKTF